MENKPWYRSKTMWAGLGLIILGIGELVVTKKIDYNGLSKILAGFGFVGLRDAIDKILE